MDLTIVTTFLQLLLAAFLGACIGLEREYKSKPAGIKTHSLVSLGAALFIVLGYRAFYDFKGEELSFDPSRVLAAVVLGVGFIGGGLIIKRAFAVEGLTTAAGLWIAAAVGAAVGMQLYLLALSAALITLFVFHGVTSLENRFIREKRRKKEQ